MTESLTIEKAMNRLFWRFGSGQFKPNQADLDSLTFMAEWINREKQRQLAENTVFGKMYVYCFMHEMEFYKDLKYSQMKLNEILNKPLEYHYITFKERLNLMELNKKKFDFGLSDSLGINSENTQKENEIISKNKKELSKYILGFWNDEQVKQALNNQITEAINRYKNLP